jgi:hypothetical protein
MRSITNVVFLEITALFYTSKYTIKEPNLRFAGRISFNLLRIES